MGAAVDGVVAAIADAIGEKPLGTSAEENGRHLQSEITRWRAFIQRHDIRPH